MNTKNQEDPKPVLSGGYYEPKPDKETFTDEQVISAIEAWLEFGEQSYCEDGTPFNKGHRGYFTHGGFADRALRFHLKTLQSR